MARNLRWPTDVTHQHDLVCTGHKLTRHGLKTAAKLISGDAAHLSPLHDPLNVGGALWELSARLAANPVKLANAQLSLWLDFAAMSQRMWLRSWGIPLEHRIRPEQGDRRFQDDAWDEHLPFHLIKKTYLLLSRWLLETVRSVDGLDEESARKVEFYVQQVVDALAPTNFAITNPVVWRATLESGGRNLVDGLHRLLDDLEKHGGRLSPEMTDLEAFEVGRNLATTPGKVIYQNELMQLIQYAPATETVARAPLLVIPPWINKYYIMDLSPANSMVKWLVEQGHTVFVISWVNPDAELSHKHFEDYLLEGPLAALDAIEQATGERSVNVAGYCLGGILLACALAYAKARGDTRIKSATLLTTMVDFADVGDIAVFMDDKQIAALERRMDAMGYLDGHSVASTFRMLRANDLVWSFFVNNYLLGKDPLPFDLLYWNSDSTRMPAAMHGYFMHNMYIENRLREPGGVVLAGVPIDVTQVDTPTYILSTREDHIAPWKTTYATSQLFSGPVRFVLGASGHIAGVVNTPARNKYGYWVGAEGEHPPSADTWLAAAEHHQGSWWPDWNRWLGQHAGGRVPARVPGQGALAPIEDAPGSYVKVGMHD
jgi:polyhydroxyalkanoate synthase